MPQMRLKPHFQQRKGDFKEKKEGGLVVVCVVLFARHARFLEKTISLLLIDLN
ncbi:hypothetical protein SPONN_1815 [uncultured Candidatus Thioglobus sp.]|nr:hypothetical protein SPONN_1815 [uncultured Candidatus Thioglobus sp.]